MGGAARTGSAMTGSSATGSPRSSSPVAGARAAGPLLSVVRELYRRRPRGLVNPYAVHQPRHDVAEGARMRQENLEAHIEAVLDGDGPDVLLVGEAPGWRGARFTGVPFSSERLILDGAVPGAGHATSLHGPHAEATATVVRRVEAELGIRALAWNALPYHPTLPGRPLTNRSPTRAELRRHAPVLHGIVAAVPDVPVVAVGRAAQRCLREAAVPHRHVVHPGRGRARPFSDQLRQIIDRR